MCAFAAQAQEKISDGVVNIGMLEDMSSVSIKVISHAAQFGHRMVLVSGLAAAMNEALDQRLRNLTVGRGLNS